MHSTRIISYAAASIFLMLCTKTIAGEPEGSAALPTTTTQGAAANTSDRTDLPGLLEQAPISKSTQGVAAAPPEILNTLLNHPNDLVLKRLSVSAELTAWIVAPEGNKSKPQVIYTTKDGRALIGTLLEADGKGSLTNLTKTFIEENTAKVDVSSFIPAIEKSAWLEDGATGPDVKATIYGFFDANCIYCHYSYLILEPYMKAGLQVRWIPVSILGPTSTTKAAHLLSLKDIRDTMRVGHGTWEANKESFPQMAEIGPDIASKLNANLDLMKAMGVTGTPGFIYRDKDGAARLIPGLIPNSKVPEITGLPLLQNHNPSVAKFN